MAVKKLRTLGVATTAEVPTLPSSMRVGASHKKSSESGATPSLYASMHQGHNPNKSGQKPNQKLIDTMKIGRGGK